MDFPDSLPTLTLSLLSFVICPSLPASPPDLILHPSRAVVGWLFFFLDFMAYQSLLVI